MKVSVVRPRDLGLGEQDRWRQIQRSNPALSNPFLSVDFTMAIGRVRDRARVAILEENQKIVGFFPHEVKALRVGVPIGAGVSDCQGLVHIPGLEWDPGALLKSCDLDVWEFDHLHAHQFPGTCAWAVHHSSPIVDLSGGYDAYLEEQRREHHNLAEVLRKKRKMARDIGELRIEFDAGAEVLPILMRWKSAQYRRMGQWDRFGAAWVVGLVSELLEVRTPECAGILSMLYAGDRPAAGILTLRGHSMLSFWFPAYDVEFAKYSPGMQVHLLLLEAAVSRGLKYFDLGKGEEFYKRQLANGELHMAEGRLERACVLALVRRAQCAPGRHIRSFVRSHPRVRKSMRQARYHLKTLSRSMFGSP